MGSTPASYSKKSNSACGFGRVDQNSSRRRSTEHRETSSKKKPRVSLNLNSEIGIGSRPRCIELSRWGSSQSCWNYFVATSIEVRHKVSRGRRTRTSIQERRAFFGCGMNTFFGEKPSKSQILQLPHYQGNATSVHGEQESHIVKIKGLSKRFGKVIQRQLITCLQ